jgi:hypothetical protein
MILVAMLAVGFVVGVQWEKTLAKGRRAKWRRKNVDLVALHPRHDPLPKVPDAADQLRTVMKAEFKPQRLLNKSEARLFRAIDKMVLEMRPAGR